MKRSQRLDYFLLPEILVAERTDEIYLWIAQPAAYPLSCSSLNVVTFTEREPELRGFSRICICTCMISGHVSGSTRFSGGNFASTILLTLYCPSLLRCDYALLTRVIFLISKTKNISLRDINTNSNFIFDHLIVLEYINPSSIIKSPSSAPDMAVSSPFHPSIMPSAIQHQEIPPFPNDVPTVPITLISHSSLLAGSITPEQKTLQACQTSGFFYLDLTTSSSGQSLLHKPKVSASSLKPCSTNPQTIKRSTLARYSK